MISRETVLVIAVVALLMMPVLSGLLMSFSPREREAIAYWWNDSRGWQIFLRTVLFSATGSTVATLAALMLILALPASPFWRRLVLMLSCLPLLVPSSLMGVGWIMALGRDAVITNALRPLLGDATPTTYNGWLAAAETGLRYLGIGAILLSIAHPRSGNDVAVARAYRLSFTQRMKLDLPRLAPALIAAWLVLFLMVQSDHILPGMFLIHTLGTEVLIQFNALMDPDAAAALSLPHAILSVAVAIVCTRLLGRSGWTRGGADGEPPAASMSARALRSGVTFLVLAIAVGIPLTGIVVRAELWSNLVLAWTGAREEAIHSAQLALAGGFLTVILILPLAHAFTRSTSKQSSLLTILFLNLGVPGSLIALGLIALPMPVFLRDSEIPLLLAYAARFAVIAALVVGVGWMRQSPLIMQAATIHAVPVFFRFRSLTVPTRLPAALAAVVLIALLIAAELEISILLVPPGVTTLGVRLYTLIHTAPDSIVAALAADILIVTALITMVVGIFVAVYNRRFRSDAC